MPLKQMLEQIALDPPHARLARLARVVRKTDLNDNFNWGRVGQTARLIRSEGVGGRMIHALHALHVPDRPALVDEARRLSYAATNAEVNRVAHGLQQRAGVGRGTPVVLMMENRVEYTICWMALFRLGAKAVHASYRLKPAELDYQVRHSGARTIVASEASVPIVQALQREAEDLDLFVVQVGGKPKKGKGPAAPLGYEALQDGVTEGMPLRAKGEELQNENVVYTSGTTGKPKGAVRDFATTNSTTFVRLLDRLPMRAGDHHLVVAPMYHSAGQAFTLMQTVLGATIHYLPHFDPEAALKALHEWDIHSVFLVPTMIRRILDLPAEVHGRYPAPELRCIVSGAAEFPHELRMRAVERFGAGVVHDFYGATELGWVTLINGEEMVAKPGSVGRANAGQVIGIFDEDGRPMGPNQVGLIYVKNEQTMVGYLNDEESTQKSRMGEWLTVEDLGFLDDEGYLFLSGRARDMVISGGVNIYPVEIEEVLVHHPGIKEIAVIGVPDAEWGERLVAVVVPQHDGQVTPDDWMAYGREKLAGYKVPKQWETIAELPRNPTGKVLKRELRERFAAAPAA